jgi:hypothetical protein
MARKTERTFKATLMRNTMKGGAWKVTYTITETRSNGLGGYDEIEIDNITTAWSNASAGKRWIKERVQQLTPRKSIKLEITSIDENEKPVKIQGTLIYKEPVKL